MMNGRIPRTRRSTAFWLVGGTLAAGAVVWGLTGQSGQATPNLPKELTYESLKAQSSDPGAMRQTMLSLRDRNDLTDEQRRETARNLRRIWQESMQERVKEYFAAADSEKQAILDRQIDEFMERMKEWEQARKADGRDGGPPGRGERGADGGGPGGMRGLFGSRSQQDRKEASESRNPDQQAQTMAYFMAAQARMKERGIPMPRGPWGGSRGGGRGP